MNTICFILIVFTCLFAKSYAGASAETTLEQMSVDEKIGQLFMIAGYVDRDYAARETENPHIIEDIDTYIKQYFIGGVGLVGPSLSSKQVSLINHYQEIAKYPLLIAQDLEWGLSMRLTDGMRFPKNITLGAISDNTLIYEMGREIGRQGRLIGVHMNLSPDIDVNIEPENPVINVRSFGASPQNVAEKGVAMIKGLQDAGLIASAKHFPGLGDITTDPHLDLPVNLHDRKRIEEVEFYPFVQAINAGVLSIQTDHVSMPALEPDVTIPSSLSPRIVQGILKEKMGFQGLVLSGALRMKALSKYFTQEEIALKAFLAGSDMLLMPHDVPRAYNAIKEALNTGKISLADLDMRVLKILKLKERYKDQKYPLKAPTVDELQTSDAKLLKKRLYQSAVTIARDKNRLVPLRQANLLAYVQIGESPSNVFYEEIKKQLKLEPFFVPLEQNDAEFTKTLLQKLEKYSAVIVAVYPADPRRIAQIRLLQAKEQGEELKHFRVHGIPQSAASLLKALESLNSKSVACFFGNPFGLHFLDGFSSVIMGYEDDPDAQAAVAQILLNS